MSQEASALSQGKSGQDVPVRYISQLVDRSILALGAVMQAWRSDSQDSGSCSYDVCEAISQALSNGARVLPKARLTQLMTERATDASRFVVQKVFDRLLQERQEKPGREMSTERVAAVLYAWTSTVGQTAPRPILRKRLFAVTSRLCLIEMRSRRTMAEIEASTSPLLQEEDLEVCSVRSLGKLQWVVMHPRMRQFLCLHWEGGRADVLIFENSMRRRSFQRFLRLVPVKQQDDSALPEGTSRNGSDVLAIEDSQREPAGGSGSGSGQTRQFRGIPEMLITPEVMTSLRDACRFDTIVNISFVKRRDYVEEAFEFYSEASELEVLIFAHERLVIVTMETFLVSITRAEDTADFAKSLADRAVPFLASETDSESDALPRKVADLGVDVERRWKLETVGQLQKLGDIQGVWVFGHSEPKMKLQFLGTEEMLLTFTSESERQRFRRHLAAILTLIQQATSWSVMPTEKLDIKEVQQQAIEMSQQTLGTLSALTS